ncbi:MAG: hypothetical protein ACRD2P_05215 [Terriglobia bacterium]
MSFNRKTLLAGVCSIALALAVGVSAQASPITLSGSVWSYVTGTTDAGNAVLASVPARTPDVTFTLTGTTIGLTSSGSTDYTLSSFLATDAGISGVTGNAAVLSAPLGPLPAPPNNGLTAQGDIFTFTGTASLTTGETFTVTHDDGTSVYVNGALLGTTTAGATSSTAEMAVYTGPDVNSANFEIVYGECCSAPADLATNLPSPAVSTVPEPSTFLLVLPAAALLLGFGLTRRFRFQG